MSALFTRRNLRPTVLSVSIPYSDWATSGWRDLRAALYQLPEITTVEMDSNTYFEFESFIENHGRVRHDVIVPSDPSAPYELILRGQGRKVKVILADPSSEEGAS